MHDVFLCYNHRDKTAVEGIASRLREKGISPWFDEWELRPGQPWQKAIEQQIREIPAAAVFVGKDGLGPWQDEEVSAFLRQFKKRSCPVIPVILPNCKGTPELPPFLEGMTWVDFRKKDPDPLKHLIWGVRGEPPDEARPVLPPPRPIVGRARWLVWMAAALAVAMASAFYLRSFVDQPPAPGERISGQITLWRHADDEMRQVGVDEDFRAGDGVRFDVKPSHDGWVFVLIRSEDGELRTLWPHTSYDNAVTAQANVIIPPDPASFKLDEDEGEERFYVAIAAVPNAEKRIRELIDERRLGGARDGLSITFAADERDPGIAITEIRLRHTAPPGL